MAIVMVIKKKDIKGKAVQTIKLFTNNTLLRKNVKAWESLFLWKRGARGG